MTSKSTPCNYTPMSHPATDNPVLHIDAGAPLRDLHACAGERLKATLKYLDLVGCIQLSDHSEQDINTVITVARILIQDVCDVFRVVEHRGFNTSD